MHSFAAHASLFFHQSPAEPQAYCLSAHDNHLLCSKSPALCSESFQTSDGLVLLVVWRSGLHVACRLLYGRLTKTKMVLLQVIEQVAKKKAIALTFLTPDKLQQALKAAHYVVKPSECDEILAYAVSDGTLSGMDQLHLLRLCDDSIGQILSYGTPSTTSTGRQTKAFYYFTNDNEKSLYDLMSGSPDLLVAESTTFTKLSKYAHCCSLLCTTFVPGLHLVYVQYTFCHLLHQLFHLLQQHAVDYAIHTLCAVLSISHGCVCKLADACLLGQQYVQTYMCNTHVTKA